MAASRYIRRSFSQVRCIRRASITKWFISYTGGPDHVPSLQFTGIAGQNSLSGFVEYNPAFPLLSFFLVLLALSRKTFDWVWLPHWAAWETCC